MHTETALNIARRAAQLGGAAIMRVYAEGDLDITQKADESPLTRADRAAHTAIADLLQPLGLPLLSEEGRSVPFAERAAWDTFWLIDPLDGTKEFIKRNGEFTVNIALIRAGRPVAGVVYVPVTQRLYYGSREGGAFRVEADGTATALRCARTDLQARGLRVVASRSHLNDDTRAFIEKLDNPELISMGSSLKFLLVAEGKAEVYPRFAPTMEWDTAAAQAIVEAAGGRVCAYPADTPLRYNKENLLNPAFWVLGQTAPAGLV